MSDWWWRAVGSGGYALGVNDDGGRGRKCVSLVVVDACRARCSFKRRDFYMWVGAWPYSKVLLRWRGPLSGSSSASRLVCCPAAPQSARSNLWGKDRNTFHPQPSFFAPSGTSSLAGKKKQQSGRYCRSRRRLLQSRRWFLAVQHFKLNWSFVFPRPQPPPPVTVHFARKALVYRKKPCRHQRCASLLSWSTFCHATDSFVTLGPFRRHRLSMDARRLPRNRQPQGPAQRRSLHRRTFNHRRHRLQRNVPPAQSRRLRGPAGCHKQFGVRRRQTKLLAVLPPQSLERQSKRVIRPSKGYTKAVCHPFQRLLLLGHRASGGELPFPNFEMKKKSFLVSSLQPSDLGGPSIPLNG